LGADAPATPKRATKRAEQFASDWQPTPEDLAWAEREGFTEQELARETPRCVRHHRSKGNVFKDRSLAWRNWMDRSRDFQGPARASPQTPSGYVPAAAARLVEADRVADDIAFFRQQARKEDSHGESRSERDRDDAALDVAFTPPHSGP
jgi:hypothetical protein